jgi:hypothetical protein
MVLVAMLISMDNVAEFVGLSPMSPVRSVTHESDHSLAGARAEPLGVG